MRTLSQILVSVNSFVDLDATLPVGDELTTRIDYANQAVWDAASEKQLPVFDQVYEVDPVAASSVSMPSGFREFKTNPRQLVGGSWIEFPEIYPQEKYEKTSGERYCYVLGNPASGYTTHLNGLTANATLSFNYQAFPTGFATLTDMCELPDPEYVVTKVEAYVLQARGDDRFPYVDAVANAKLKSMVGRAAKSPGGQVVTARKGFRNPLS